MLLQSLAVARGGTGVKNARERETRQEEGKGGEDGKGNCAVCIHRNLQKLVPMHQPGSVYVTTMQEA